MIKVFLLVLFTGREMRSNEHHEGNKKPASFGSGI
ncbi:hypothetical protein M3J09_011621 [Ascochyta lentis]